MDDFAIVELLVEYAHADGEVRSRLGSHRGGGTAFGRGGGAGDGVRGRHRALPRWAARHRARRLAFRDMCEGIALRRPIGAPQALPAAETLLAVDLFGRAFADAAAGDAAHPRSEERRVGKEGVSPGRTGGWRAQ